MVVVGRDDQDLEAFAVCLVSLLTVTHQSDIQNIKIMGMLRARREVRQCPLLARHADHITIAQPRIRTGPENSKRRIPHCKVMRDLHVGLRGISSSAVRQHLAAGESIRYLVHDKARERLRP